MLQAHEEYERVFVWFLAHDPRVPQSLQEEESNGGRDNHATSQPTATAGATRVNAKAGRMLGRIRVMTQADILKNNRKNDSVGVWAHSCSTLTGCAVSNAVSLGSRGRPSR